MSAAFIAALKLAKPAVLPCNRKKLDLLSEVKVADSDQPVEAPTSSSSTAGRGSDALAAGGSRRRR